MYLSEKDKDKIIEICKRNDISFCAVFGSFARGDATQDSDVDLLVKFSKPVGFSFFAAALAFEDALGRRVDLATDCMIGPYILDDVMSQLQTIYEETEESAPAPAYS